MIDPTGIVGVIGVAGQIIQYIFKFCYNWREAKEEAGSFIQEVWALKTTLQNVHDLLSDPDFANAFKDISSALLSKRNPLPNTGPTDTGQDENDSGELELDISSLLSTCEKELQRLLSDLKRLAGGHRFGWERLKAALVGRKTREAVENLHRQCQTLTSLLEFGQLKLQNKILKEAIEARKDQNRNHQAQTQKLQSIEQRMDGIEAGVNIFFEQTYTAEARQKHGEMLEWLSSVDYSSQQADFLRQRQEGTGQWFLNSPQFQEWYILGFLHICLIPIFSSY